MPISHIASFQNAAASFRHAASFENAGKNIFDGAGKIADGQGLKGTKQIVTGLAQSVAAAGMTPITLPTLAVKAALPTGKSLLDKFNQCRSNMPSRAEFLEQGREVGHTVLRTLDKVNFNHAGKTISNVAKHIDSGEHLKGAKGIAAGTGLLLGATIRLVVTAPIKAGTPQLKAAGKKLLRAFKQCHGKIDAKLPWLKTIGQQMDTKIASSIKGGVNALAATFQGSKTLDDLSHFLNRTITDKTTRKAETLAAETPEITPPREWPIVNDWTAEEWFIGDTATTEKMPIEETETAEERPIEETETAVDRFGTYNPIHYNNIFDLDDDDYDFGGNVNPAQA